MNNKCVLLRRIAAVDFALYELTEYLDTHPYDRKAMNLREQYRAKRLELINTYEAQFGPYVRTADDVQGERWSWIDNPWPWDYGQED